MKIIVKKIRKDQKFMVTCLLSGGPNGFGGTNFGRSFNKVYTFDQVAGYAANKDVEFVNYTHINFNN